MVIHCDSAPLVTSACVYSPFPAPSNRLTTQLRSHAPSRKGPPSHLKGRDFTATGLNQREKGARTTGLTVTQLPLPLSAHLFDRTRFWRREVAGSIRLDLSGTGEFQGELVWVSVETVKEQGKEDYNARKPETRLRYETYLVQSFLCFPFVLTW